MLGLGNILTKGGAVIQKFPNEYSFNLDGSNDYLKFEDEFVFSGAFTVSFWVKHNSSGDEYTLGKQAGDQDGFILHPSASRWKIANVNTQSNTSIVANQWHHILAVRNSSNLFKWYVNGSSATLSDGSSYVTTGVTRSGDFDIDQIGRIGSALYGEIQVDEVAFWDTALSASDVAKLASKPVDLTKYSASNLKLWLRAGDKVLPESDTLIARSDFYTDFDGVDDYVNVGSDSSIDDIWTGGGTITGWINIRSTGEDNGMFVVKRGSDSGWHISTKDESGDTCKLRLAVRWDNFGQWTTTSRDITFNEWIHIAVSYDNGSTSNNPNIYINGVSVAITTVTAPSGTYESDASDDLYIGGEAGAFTTDSAISNLALHQTILDAQTISQIAKSRYTPMRDNRFSVVDFDGSNDYIDCGNDSSLELAGDMTITAWINPTGADSSQGIVTKRDSGGTNYYFALDSSTPPKLTFYDGSGSGTSTGTITKDSWQHIAISIDSGVTNGSIFYINGIASGTATLTITADDAPLVIGRRLSDNYYEGSISSASVYSTAKSAEEIYAQYSKGITHNPSADTGLVGLWLMGDDTSKAYPTIADSSSNSNDGTASGAVEAQQMVAGYDMGAFESSSEELSSELIADGDFALTGTQGASTTGTYWYTNGQMTIANGKAHFADTGGGSLYLEGDSPFASTGLYKFQFEVSNTVSGSAKLRIKEGNNILINTTYDDGTHQIYFQITSTGGQFKIEPRKSDGVEHDLSNLSLKKVLQSEVSDTYPLLVDVNAPVLGAEEVSEPSFASSTGWTLGTGWSISSNTLSSDGSQSAGSNASASITTGAGYYRVVITVDSISSGTIKPNLESWGSYISTTGTSTQLFTLTGNNDLTIQASADFVGSISFASVKEVFGNFGTMTQMLSSNLVYSSVLPDQSFLTGVNSAYNFLDFDETDAYVDTGSSYSDTFNDSFTVSFWIESNDGQGSTRNFAGTEGTSADYLEFRNVSTGKLSLIYRSDGGTIFTATTNDVLLSNGQNDWHHIVFVLDNTAKQVSIYFDGENKTLDSTDDGDFTGVTISAFDTSQNLYIGANNANGTSERFYSGSINQFAIWNKALSSTEINSIYTAGRHTNLLDSYSDNLKGYYAFGALDAITGLADTDSTIYDRSGNSNHGTTSGTATGDLKSPPNAEPNGYAKGDTNRSNNTP